MRYLFVRDCGLDFDILGQFPEPGAEDDAEFGLEVGLSS
jgi:hypothetical protein